MTETTLLDEGAVSEIEAAQVKRRESLAFHQSEYHGLPSPPYIAEIDALCATVKHLREDAKSKKIELLQLSGRGELLTKVHVRFDDLDEVAAVRNEFDRLRNIVIGDLQSQLEQLRAENVSLTKSLRDAYDFYMGPQACGDFTCTCDQPKLCGICEIREATELTLADDLLATTPVVNCNPPG